MQIIKRNGKAVEFDKSKIEVAIGKALGETLESIEWGDYEHLVASICNHIEPLTSVEDIQDLVEVELMRAGLYDTAKRYILYRQDRVNSREKGWSMSDLQQDIFQQKYEYKKEGFAGFTGRVSGGNEKIRKLIRDKKFLFGGRILASRGLQNDGKKITYSNCYVLPAPEDNIESIFDTAKQMARTFSYGGGVGIDIGKLRPNGATINNAAKETTGAVSFMDLYSLTTGLISQRGRRGALMISIPSTHPDLEEFIDIKNDLAKINSANISVRVKDDFMQAVINKTLYTLQFVVEATGQVIEKVVDADKVFSKLALNNYNVGEPGVLFWDRIKSHHLMSEDSSFEYAGTNPCGEEPLPDFGACLLGSINLSEYVINPFASDAKFDFESYSKDVKKAVVALNEVLDEGLELHPLPEQTKTAKNLRQIGLGILGYGDMLIKLGLKYGSREALNITDIVGSTLANSALQQSAMLAKEYGTFPLYNKDYVLASSYLNKVATPETRNMIEQYGLRNSQLLTSAPTGTLSTLLGTSGGIEPLYSISYTRKTETLNQGEETYYKVFTPIAKEYMKLNNIEKEDDLPDFFVTAMTLNWKDRVDTQSVWQKYIDASISSTVNLPENVTVDEVKELYIYAWQKGLKGITIFRDNCKRAGVLSNKNSKNQNVESLSIDQLQDIIKDKANEKLKTNPNTCPMCNGKLKHEGGCSECLDCGYSPCSV